MVVGVVGVVHAGKGEVRYTKQVLADMYFCDGIAAGNINRDGKTDIVAGPYWYQGPDFRVRHAFHPPVAHKTEPSPTNSMFSFVHDFNADGWPDILVLGRIHKHAAYWYENPRGKAGHWKKHFVFECVRGESPTLADIDADGKPELICHWQNRWGWLSPDGSKPTGPWRFRPISKPGNYNQFYHGTGVGDINGDGRLDLIINDGWWEQPKKPQPVWPFHAFRFAKRGGAQMFVYDVDGDGDPDVITSLDAHGWGLAWFEHVKKDGAVTFRRHTIMGSRKEQDRYGVAFSQPHALALADVSGDGLMDIVVGKRMWAHGPKGDIEPSADPVVYWFELRRRPKITFVPHLVDSRSGVGTQVAATDVNGDKITDILSASKLGSFVFLGRRVSKDQANSPKKQRP